MLDHYLRNQWAAIGGSVLLVFRPPLMDILPMYILFSFLTAAAFAAARRWGWKIVLLCSASIWLVAQTHARDLLITAFEGVSFIQLGPFDLFAWQLLWVTGLFLGQRFYKEKTLLALPGVLNPLLLLCTVAFLVWRWSSIAFGSDLVDQTWLLDKWHLGPLRLMNFFAAAFVTARLLKNLNRWETPLKPLSLIGRHMLPVFCSQICLHCFSLAAPIRPRQMNR